MGLAVGLLVGDDVGELVGLLVGEPVGELVGLLVGLAVGTVMLKASSQLFSVVVAASGSVGAVVRRE